MRCRVVSLLVLVSWAARGEAQPVFVPGMRVQVIDAVARARASADLQSAIVASWPRGTELTVEQVAGAWLLVFRGRDKGYVRRASVTPSAPVDASRADGQAADGTSIPTPSSRDSVPLATPRIAASQQRPARREVPAIDERDDRRGLAFELAVASVHPGTGVIAATAASDEWRGRLFATGVGVDAQARLSGRRWSIGAGGAQTRHAESGAFGVGFLPATTVTVAFAEPRFTLVASERGHVDLFVRGGRFATSSNSSVTSDNGFRVDVTSNSSGWSAEAGGLIGLQLTTRLGLHLGAGVGRWMATGGRTVVTDAEGQRLFEADREDRGRYRLAVRPLLRLGVQWQP